LACPLKYYSDISAKEIILSKVLIVDNEQATRELIALVIGQFLKCDFEFAKSGTEAIEKVKRDSYDLIMIDILMPDVNGIETIKSIKKIKPDLPVIIMSNFSKMTANHEMLLNEADQVIDKPFSLKQMMESAESFVLI